MWLWFVEKGWLYCMLIMGIILTVQLIVHWKDWNILRKLAAFTVIVLVFHVWVSSRKIKFLSPAQKQRIIISVP